MVTGRKELSHSELASWCLRLLPIRPRRCSSKDWVMETEAHRGAVMCYSGGFLTLGSGWDGRRDEGDM